MISGRTLMIWDLRKGSASAPFLALSTCTGAVQ